MAADRLRARRLSGSGACLAAVLALVLAAPGVRAEGDPWQPLRPFVGSWQGTGEGLGGAATVEHAYEFVLQDKFLRMRTKSVFAAAADGTPGEVHEDWGMFSYDPDRQRLVWRQFLTEGLVNTYRLDEASPDGRRQVWVTESAEGAGGTAARITYDFVADDEYPLILELQPPGGEFFVCRRLRMRRLP